MQLLQASVGGAYFGLDELLILLVSGLIIYFLVKLTRAISTVTNQAATLFEDMQFSSQEFYGLLEALIKERQMPGVSTNRVYHSMHGAFSGKREYLRVQYQKYFFDICAAPFAKDFFVSYRQGTLKVWIRRRRQKTFYEQDTEAMFHSSVLLCYNRAIEQMETKKGKRVSAENLVQLQ